MVDQPSENHRVSANYYLTEGLQQHIEHKEKVEVIN